MPRPRRSPKQAKAKRDENDLSLRELVVFLEQGDGFHLGLAYVDSFETRQTILRRLTALMADRPVALSVLDLGKLPGEELLLTRLKEHVRDHPAPEGKKPAVMVVGLEALLDYRDVHPYLPAPQPILRNANFQRDAFPHLVPATVVLWLLPTASTLFAQEAPDLWHWRSGTFQFTGPPNTRRNQERAEIERPLIESDNLATPAKRERIALLRDLLVDLENDPDRDTPGGLARRARLLLELGMAHFAISEVEMARSYFDEALTLFRQVGDRRDEGNALGNLGVACYSLGQLKRAIGYHEQALAIHREVGDRRGEGADLGNLGIAYKNLGQLDRAIGYYEQALAIAREVGDRRGEGNAFGNLGSAYADLGQLDRAVGYYEQHLAIAREIGDRRGEGIALGNLGNAYADLGQWERAIGFYEQALAIDREIGERHGEGIALGNLGRAYAALGQMERAIGYLEQGLQIGRAIKNPRVILLCEAALAHVKDRAAPGAEQADPGLSPGA
jgi:tetratricopeptide (TPR) repeat protein